MSGHGLGHASRDIEVMNALARLDPGIRIVVRTPAARWLFDRTAPPTVEFHRYVCDTGVVQLDSLRLDERETIRCASAFHGDLAARATEEAHWLRTITSERLLIVGDIPPLAFATASAANLQGVALGNFTWDWIYEAYADALADAPALLPSIREAYSKADAAWRLPMSGGFQTFRTVVDLPFIARHATHGRDEVRRTFGWPAERLMVLVSFGGYGLPDLPVGSLDCLDRYGVVLTRGAHDPPRDGGGQAGLFIVDEDRLYAHGFRYEDLVGAVDIVVSKPGYGIISECIANGAGLLYTSRGRFAEYNVLVSEMPRYLRCEFIDRESLFAGRWSTALDRLSAQPPPPEHPRTDGAEVAARMILDIITTS